VEVEMECFEFEETFADTMPFSPRIVSSWGIKMSMRRFVMKACWCGRGSLCRLEYQIPVFNG
jgi:hypothetical protein